MAGITASYVDADSFTVVTDRTAEFSVGRRVKALCGTDGTKYGTVESVSYTSPNTTVNLYSTNDDLTNKLTEVWFGRQGQGTTGSVPMHDHDGYEGSGGSLSPSVFYADSDETDQGVGGNGKTIKTFVDAIGSDSATIYLRHNSGSATTTYTLTTSETIPSNITLEIEPGVILDGAGTLVINGPFKSGLSQVFGSSITISFGSGHIQKVYPQWWGAIGDSSHDDTTAIQAAIDTGIPVLLPKGQYKTTTTLTMYANNLYFAGAGTRISIIAPAFASGNVLVLGDGVTAYKNITLQDFTIDTPSAVTRTANAGIQYNKVEQINTERIELNDQFEGIKILGDCTHLVYNDIVIRNCVAATGTGVFIDGGADHFFNNLSINAATDAEPLAGIRIKNSAATWIDNSDILHSGMGLLINPGDGDSITWLFITNTAFDYNDYDGIRITPTHANSVVVGCQFTSCWTSSNTLVGVRIAGPGAIDGIYFADHRAVNNDLQGYRLSGGINICLDSCNIAGNSQDSDGVSAGIHIDADVSKFAIRGCTVGRQMEYTVDHSRAVQIEAGTGDDYIVTDNDFTNNDAAPLNLATGTNGVWENNLIDVALNVASAATITLSSELGDLINVTGTTNITSITASRIGRKITLKFAGILTFTDGSNLKLAGDFVTTADDTITIVCDGTNWYEVSRSVN